MSILVSIIIPAFNAEKYIVKTINSVLNQSYGNFEIIVIDDGSQDDTVKLVTAMAEKDKRINLYQNKRNLGVSETRNRGISLAKGNWIAFLDSDDMWTADKLEKQIILLKHSDGINFFFTGSSFIDESDNTYSYVLNIPDKVRYRDLLKQNIISCSSVLIRKECLTGFKMERDDLHEDFAMWLQILKKECCAYGINEPLLIYRISKKSKSGNKIKAAKMTFLVYRHVGLNIFQSAYYMFFYIGRSLKKYKSIKSA